MSSKTRKRTTGPKYRDIKTTRDLTDWLNRAVARGGRGTTRIAQKRHKADFFGIFGHQGRRR